ncbi:MAG: glycine cleavage system protein H [Candidatus Helarchaeota archaeon]
MPAIDGYDFPEDVLINEHNLWTKPAPDGENYAIGITDFAQQNLDSITFVEIVLEEGEQAKYNRPFGALLASGKGSITLYSPLTGEIVEINERLDDEPALIKQDCYGEGWIMKIKPSKIEEETDKLMAPGSEHFKTWQLKEIERVKKINEELKNK